MVQWLGWIAWAYPNVDPADGWWYPPTSTINWCEVDYYETFMIAEYMNTITNLLFMWLGIKGIRNCLAQKWDRVYLMSFVGYMIVGTGSALFHATLKYPMQLVDELSMIYTTCIMFYAVYSFKQSVLSRSLLAGGLLILCASITAYYHYLQDPTFHQHAYGILTALVVCRSMYIMDAHLRPSSQPGYKRSKEKAMNETEVPPSPPGVVPTNGNGPAKRKKNRKRKTNGHTNGVTNGNGHSYHTRSKDKVYAATNGNGHAKPIPNEAKPVTAESEAHDLTILHRMWGIVISSLVIFLGGFLFWNLDNAYCPTIRDWRHAVGLPWGIFLEGHAWWHLMTGTAAYMSLVWGIWLRECLKGNKEGVVCRWLGYFERLGGEHKDHSGWRWLPEVVRVERDKETGELRLLGKNAHLHVE